MSRLRARLSTAPVWALSLYYGIAFGAWTLLAPGTDEIRSLKWAGLRGLFFGTCMGIYTAVMRRRDRHAAGSNRKADLVAMNRALTSGEAPADASLDGPLLGLIKRRRLQIGWASIVSPFLFGAGAVVCILLAIFVHDAIWLAYAVAYVALFIVAWRASSRSLSRLDRVESTIHQRAPANQTPPASISPD